MDDRASQALSRRAGQTLASGTTRISGRIKGYTPELGFDNFIIYLPDIVKGSQPYMVPIAKDGSFDSELKLERASNDILAVVGDKARVRLYLEPGSDLEMLIDWDLSGNRSKGSRVIHFGGTLGEINEDIARAPQLRSITDRQWGDTCLPSEALRRVEILDSLNAANLAAWLDTARVHPHAGYLLDLNRRVNTAGQLMKYDQDRRYSGWFNKNSRSSTEELDSAFFAPLHMVYNGDPWIVAARDIDFLSNQLSSGSFYSTFGARYMANCKISRQPVFMYLDARPGLIDLPADIDSIRRYEIANEGRSLWLTMEFGNRIADAANRAIGLVREAGMQENYEAWTTDSLKDYTYTPLSYRIPSTERLEALRRFIPTDIPQPLFELCEIQKIGLNLDIHQLTEEKVMEQLSTLQTDSIVTDNDLLRSLTDFLRQNMESIRGCALPDDPRGQLMGELIEPHKGKFVLVDFWSTGCGPCRANIERTRPLREANRNHPGIAFVFITSENESPEKTYDEYVARHLIDDIVHRLPQSEYNKLLDLFHFNAIPRYILFGPQGQVLDDNFRRDLGKTLEEFGVMLNSPAR